MEAKIKAKMKLQKKILLKQRMRIKKYKKMAAIGNLARLSSTNTYKFSAPLYSLAKNIFLFSFVSAAKVGRSHKSAARSINPVSLIKIFNKNYRSYQVILSGNIKRKKKKIKKKSRLKLKRRIKRIVKEYKNSLLEHFIRQNYK